MWDKITNRSQIIRIRERNNEKKISLSKRKFVDTREKNKKIGVFRSESCISVISEIFQYLIMIIIIRIIYR